MNKNDIEFVEYIQKMISDKVTKEINKIKYVKAYPAIVTSVNGNFANVKMPSDDTVLTNLKNKTHETLNVNDNVYLFSPSNNLTNSFIAFKF